MEPIRIVAMAFKWSLDIAREYERHPTTKNIDAEKEDLWKTRTNKNITQPRSLLCCTHQIQSKYTRILQCQQERHHHHRQYITVYYHITVSKLQRQYRKEIIHKFKTEIFCGRIQEENLLLLFLWHPNEHWSMQSSPQNRESVSLLYLNPAESPTPMSQDPFLPCS